MWLALAIRASREVASWAKSHPLRKLMRKLSVFKLNSLCSQHGPGLGSSGRAAILEALGSTESMNQYMEIDLCGQVSHTELLDSVKQSSFCWPANTKGRPINFTESSIWRSCLYPAVSSPSFKSVEEGL